MNEWIEIEAWCELQRENGAFSNKPDWFFAHYNPGLVKTVGPFSSKQDAIDAALRYTVSLGRPIPIRARP